MRREVARQSPVNLLVTQLLGMLIQPQRFNFDGTYLILQHLVGTKLDALQLNLGGFFVWSQRVTGSVLVSTG